MIIHVLSIGHIFIFMDAYQWSKIYGLRLQIVDAGTLTSDLL